MLSGGSLPLRTVLPAFLKFTWDDKEASGPWRLLLFHSGCSYRCSARRLDVEPSLMRVVF